MRAEIRIIIESDADTSSHALAERFSVDFENARTSGIIGVNISVVAVEYVAAPVHSPEWRRDNGID